MRTTLPRPRLLAALLAATVGVSATGWMLTRNDESPVNVAGSTTVAAPIPTPVVSPLGVTAGRVAWDRSLTLVVTDGVLKEVTALGPDGQLVDGQLSGTGWSSTSDLLPASTYRLAVLLHSVQAREIRSWCCRSFLQCQEQFPCCRRSSTPTAT